MQAEDETKYLRKDLHIVDLISLSETGISDSEISRKLGCSTPNISQKKQIYGYSRGRNVNYRAAEPSIIRWIQGLLISGITMEKVKKMSVRDIGITWGIFFDKLRLLEGQSTENLDIRAAYDSMSNIDKVKSRIISVLQSKGIDINQLQQQVEAEAGE